MTAERSVNPATGERCDWCDGYFLERDTRHEHEGKVYHRWCLTHATCWLGMACKCSDEVDVWECELRRHPPDD